MVNVCNPGISHEIIQWIRIENWKRFLMFYQGTVEGFSPYRYIESHAKDDCRRKCPGDECCKEIAIYADEQRFFHCH